MPEMHRLSQLVLGHRGKLRKIEAELLGDASSTQQLLCLRLAVALCHARRNPDLQGLRLTRQGQHFLLALPAGWLTNYPQSSHLLREEVAAWEKTPWALVLQEPPAPWLAL